MTSKKIEIIDLTLTARTKYLKSGDSSFGYDAAGNLKKFKFRKDHQNEGETGVKHTHTIIYTYRARECYEAAAIDEFAAKQSVAKCSISDTERAESLSEPPHRLFCGSTSCVATQPFPYTPWKISPHPL